MDPALPRGGLQRIFQQYDSIRSHAARDDGPAPWEPEADEVKPEQPKGGLSDSSTPPTGGVVSNTPPFRTKERVELANRSRQQVLTDGTRPRPVGRPWGEDRAQKAAELLEKNLQRNFKHFDQENELIEKRLREAEDRSVLEARLKNPQGATFKEDEAGMDAAYAYRSYPGAAYNPDTETLYIAGSDSWRSWYDDFVNIPVWGDLKNSERYKQAEFAYEDLTKKQGKNVRRVVGHSLGGSVALELAKNKGIEYSRTFGAPVVDPNPFHRGSVERWRHPLDPVSLLDRGATWGKVLAYPHSYTGFQHFDEPAPYIFDVGQKKKLTQQVFTA